MKFILFKMFLTIIASTVASLFRKDQSVIRAPFTFTAVQNGLKKVTSQAIIAYLNNNHLHIQVVLSSQTVLTMHLYGFTGRGIYEFSCSHSTHPNELKLENKAWPGEVYTSYSSSAGGYIEIVSFTPYLVEAAFSITAVLESPDFSLPVSRVEFTQGYVRAPLIRKQ